VARPKRITPGRRRDHPDPRFRIDPGQPDEPCVIRKVTPARILIHTPRATPATYCWRDAWLTGFDSAYSLLSKFALLNAMTARELTTLVVSRTCGRRTRLIKHPDCDLRDSSLIDVPKLARLCRTSEELITRGFVFGNFPAPRSDCATVLRYCPECLRRGWHVALFQLKFIRRCPIHQLPLQEPCPACGGRIPYQLAAAAINDPFTCSHCQADLAPALGAPGVPPLDEEERAALRNAIDTAAGLSAFLHHHHPLAQLLSFFGTSRVMMSPPSPRRAREEYAAFLDALVHRLRPQLSPSTPNGALIEIVRGEPCVRTRSASQRERRRRPGAARAGSRTMPLVQPPIYPSTCWDGADRGLLDRKLESILPLYGALRRHVWRAIVGVHQACAKGAAARLNYDTEGAFVATSCPVASAYLRWRLYWEGLRVPADLFRPPRHLPFGVLAWLCDGAPVAAESWTLRGDQWLEHRVFAMDCIRDFAAWWRLCKSAANGNDATIRWWRAAAGGYGRTYWAATGHDRPTAPLRVFLETRKDSDCFYDSTVSEAHRPFHHRPLSGISSSIETGNVLRSSEPKLNEYFDTMGSEADQIIYLYERHAHKYVIDRGHQI